MLRCEYVKVLKCEYVQKVFNYKLSTINYFTTTTGVTANLFWFSTACRKAGQSEAS